MKIRTQKLRDALELVAPAVGGRKATLPGLRYVRVGEGALVATDLEVRVQVELPEAQDPPFLMPHKLALDFLKAVPGDTLMWVGGPSEGADEGVGIQAGSVRGRFHGPKAEEFPPSPEMASPQEAEVDGDALVQALEEAAAYAATEDSRPVLNGVCLVLGDPAEVCAADGYRLTRRALSFSLSPGEGGPDELIIPRPAVRVLGKLWKGGEKPPVLPDDGALVSLLVARRPLRLRYTKEFLEVSFGGITLLTHLVQGSFPSYHHLIPSPQASRVTVMAERLHLALRQVQKVAQDGSGIIRLSWEGNTLRVAARAAEVGEVESEVPARVEGQAGRIAFNQRYLADYLKGREGPMILQVDKSSSPALLTAPGAPQVVLMPMALSGEEGPAPQGKTSEPPAAEAAEERPGEGPDEAEVPHEESSASSQEPEAPPARGRGRRKKREG